MGGAVEALDAGQPEAFVASLQARLEWVHAVRICTHPPLTYPVLQRTALPLLQEPVRGAGHCRLADVGAVARRRHRRLLVLPHAPLKEVHLPPAARRASQRYKLRVRRKLPPRRRPRRLSSTSHST